MDWTDKRDRTDKMDRTCKLQIDLIKSKFKGFEPVVKLNSMDKKWVYRD
jgi:hypothetical protein